MWHDQWVVGHLFYSDPSQWCAWGLYCSLEGTLAGWSSVAHAFYSWHGCLISAGTVAVGGGAPTTLVSEAIEALDLALCGAVIFLRPNPMDIYLVLDIIRLFSKASGLQTNIRKSSVVPIWCVEQSLVTAKELLPCEFVDFPCKYLGLPLSIWKLPKSHIQSIVDRMASMLLKWKAELMNHVGQSIHVKFVMTMKIIYTTMGIQCHGLVCKGVSYGRAAKAWKGGHCLLAWPKVTCPKELGGLGIHDVSMLGWALRAHWSWLQRTKPEKHRAQILKVA
jgi:hypothetical protein